MSLSKITSWILYVLMAVSIVAIVMFYLSGTGEEVVDGNMFVDYNLYWSYLLVIIAIGATILLSMVNFIKNLIADPKSAIKSFLPLVGLALVIGVSYAMADGSKLYMPTYDGSDNVAGWLKFADTLFFTTYFLFGVAILAVIVSSVSRIFR